MKKQLAAGLACYMLATTAQADVVIGNPMAVTGPIPDLVAPMVAAVDLAEKHIMSKAVCLQVVKNSL